MSPPQPYTPIDTFPDLDGSGGGGPLTLAEDADVYLYEEQVRSDADIQSIANTTPIQVTTATAHLLVTGNKVTIVGAAVSAAIGTFTITKISGSVFSLNGTTAAGAGGAFGRAFNAKLGIISRLIDGLQWLWKHDRPLPSQTRDYIRILGSDGDAFAALDGNTGTLPTIQLPPGSAHTFIAIDIPDGCTVTGISVTWTGLNLPGSEVPADFEVFKIRLGTSITSLSATLTAATMTFTSTHTETLVLNGGSFTHDPLYVYALRVKHWAGSAGGATAEINRVRATLLR